jgi:hypothetical protein
MQWIFTPKSPSTKTRDPISSEYFSNEAIDNAGQALVREAIQNSLDARLKGSSDPVRIRIFVSGDDAALSPAGHRRWFKEAWPHYHAKGNGLQHGRLSPSMHCRFLVIEDFGTTGLTGDHAQFQEVPSVKNSFFYFFRAEGKTAKKGDDRGRWGIGKQVFPRSSLAQTHFGYSETDTGAFVMGSCILKHHQVGRETYVPDGYFGVPKIIRGVDQVAMPLTDPGVIAQFRTDFRVSRQPGQWGTTIVVPWLDAEDKDGDADSAFTRDQLAMAVLEEYLLPLMDRRVAVTVEDTDGAICLTADSYEAGLQQLSHSPVPSVPARAAKLQPFVELAKRIEGGDYRDYHLNPFPQEKPTWVDSVLPEEKRQEIKADLLVGKVVRVTAHVTVRRKGEEEGHPERRDNSSFDCYLFRNAVDAVPPRFLREDLLISGLRSKAVSGCTSLVRIEKGHLATMLGDAENPAHTEWSAKSENFKNRYVFGPAMLSLVIGFPSELHKALTTEPARVDRSLLLDLFHDSGPELPTDDGLEVVPPTGEVDPPEGGEGPGPGTDDEGSTPPPVVPSLPIPSRPYRVLDTEDGFAIVSTASPFPQETLLRIRCAYITTRGSALKKYNRVDFDFSKSKLMLQLDGVAAEKADANELLLRVTGTTFQVRVAGFDRNRDLEVHATLVDNGTETR